MSIFVVRLGVLRRVSCSREHLRRLFRVLRVLRLVKRAKGVRKMLRTLRFALPAILNVGGILLLLLVVYAVMGMQLFGGAQHRVFVTRLANFDNFPLAMLTLFRITTGASARSRLRTRNLSPLLMERAPFVAGEAWNGIMTDLMRKPSEQCETGGECGSYAAVPYFFSFVLLVQMVMMNLFVAVVIEEFDGDFAKADEPEVPVTSEDINGYVHAWAEFNPVVRARVRERVRLCVLVAGAPSRAHLHVTAAVVEAVGEAGLLDAVAALPTGFELTQGFVRLPRRVAFSRSRPRLTSCAPSQATLVSHSLRTAALSSITCVSCGCRFISEP